MAYPADRYWVPLALGQQASIPTSLEHDQEQLGLR